LLSFPLQNPIFFFITHPPSSDKFDLQYMFLKIVSEQMTDTEKSEMREMGVIGGEPQDEVEDVLEEFEVEVICCCYCCCYCCCRRRCFCYCYYCCCYYSCCLNYSIVTAVLWLTFHRCQRSLRKLPSYPPSLPLQLPNIQKLSTHLLVWSFLMLLLLVVFLLY
jgi:hypothetical protein